MREVVPRSPRELTLHARDGYALAASLFEARGVARRATLVVNSATAVPRRFYARFASFMSEHGLRVLTYDYRGIGGSREGSASASSATMLDWGRLDFAGVLEELERMFPGEPIRVVGHSVGGQLLGLADNGARVERLVLVAAQEGYWRLWPRPARYALAALWTAFGTALSAKLQDVVNSI